MTARPLSACTVSRPGGWWSGSPLPRAGKASPAAAATVTIRASDPPPALARVTPLPVNRSLSGLDPTKRRPPVVLSGITPIGCLRATRRLAP